MQFTLLYGLLASTCSIATTVSTQGLHDLIARRLPSASNDFQFILTDTPTSNKSTPPNDAFTISTVNGSVAIDGTSLSALATGLRRYFTEVAHVDVYWGVGSRLSEAPSLIPRPVGRIEGESVVPWRYFFNTVTFSYTTPFWTWADWELELDWLALHGVNLPLAWVGFEKILLEVFRDINLDDSDILPFFSGPAFQSWNRFGNIQGSWGGDLPLQWIEDQFVLQKRILKRMLELGMTPILPAFTGFVPRALAVTYSNASVVNGSRWEDFPLKYTNTTFLEPSDALFSELQNRVIKKQIEYYGYITQFYTLDQYNENDPFSGDLDYLRNVTRGTWQSLKNANPAAVWVMQGWLFYSNSDFWTNERIEAYLSGVENDEDMLVLDLFSESQPQWQRTNSYYGKPWVWNELHNYGGNMGLYGQVDNLTINPIEALQNSSTMVGMGLTPEGQEGNEIVYALLLDQAWQESPINTQTYFRDWVTVRYTGNNTIPPLLYTAWETLRTTVYNNTHLLANAVPKAIYELAPNTTGLTNRTGHHPTQLNYDPQVVIEAWKYFYAAAKHEKRLWKNAAFAHDFVDLTRQVFANAFLNDYEDFIVTWNTTVTTKQSYKRTNALRAHASKMILSLSALDAVLSTLPQFSLAPWINSARSLAPVNESRIADFYEYNARNQITLWGPEGEISDYASKSWGGLVAEYYLPRWNVFLAYAVDNGPESYNSSAVRQAVSVVEGRFQMPGSGLGMGSKRQDLKRVAEKQVYSVLKKLGVL